VNRCRGDRDTGWPVGRWCLGTSVAETTISTWRHSKPWPWSRVAACTSAVLIRRGPIFPEPTVLELIEEVEAEAAADSSRDGTQLPNLEANLCPN